MRMSNTALHNYLSDNQKETTPHTDNISYCFIICYVVVCFIVVQYNAEHRRGIYQALTNNLFNARMICTARLTAIVHVLMDGPGA